MLKLKREYVIFLLLFICCTVVFSDNSGEKNIFQLTMKTGIAFNLYEPWLTANFEFDYLIFKRFGIGVEAGLYYGIFYQDIYTTITSFIKLGMLYYGIGIICQITDPVLLPDSPYNSFLSESEPITQTLTMGIILPALKDHSGTFNCNISLDIFFTDIPFIKNTEDSTDLPEGMSTSFPIGTIIGISQVMAALISLAKLNFEISYSFAL